MGVPAVRGAGLQQWKTGLDQVSPKQVTGGERWESTQGGSSQVGKNVRDLVTLV